ncbi:MAG TPA: glycoside hydrolase family 28 protein [Bacteroidales bacterium]|nr:glycoside hydrolase family 28 protein [Bacteroidales bacterium]
MKSKPRPLILLLFCFLAVSIFAKTVEPDWVKDAGAKIQPLSTKIFNANTFGATPDSTKLSSKAIQAAIDECSKQGGGTVILNPGKYLIGSIFLKKGVNFHLDEGVVLLGSPNLTDYPEIDTRVAGVEMKWPAALINILDQENVCLSGKGLIDAQGKPFWDSYGAMRSVYVPKGLRWIVDYDCKRPRCVLVQNSKNITVSEVTIQRSGFWTVQVLYSTYVTINKVFVRNNVGGHGPSTDGVDIDSSTKVLVENCNIDCNDDNFCLKAGRDADGLRVNRPCEYIVIRNCVAGAGGGLITCGSETSGGIRNIWVDNLTALGTSVGFRVKSALNRGGVVENIFINNLTMTNVAVPIEVTTNWNPSYSYSELPKGFAYDTIPVHWKKMLEKVPAAKGIPVFKNIHVNNLVATSARRAISVSGMAESIVDGFYLDNVVIDARSAGSINYSKGWRFKNVLLNTPDSLKVTNCIDMQLK